MGKQTGSKHIDLTLEQKLELIIINIWTSHLYSSKIRIHRSHTLEVWSATGAEGKDQQDINILTDAAFTKLGSELGSRKLREGLRGLK